MSCEFLVAPDFAPERFAGWHMLNTLLQKKANINLHLLTPPSAAEQAQLVADGKVDFVYANPFDASTMIREHGFEAVARPIGKPDEMVIATAASSSANGVEDLKPGCKIALTDNKDVKLIGLRLLEIADLNESDVQWQLVENYQAAARLAMKGEVDASFFLLEAYNSLSKLTQSQLKPLIESKLADITHVLLAHPKAADDAKKLVEALIGLAGSPEGDSVLKELGFGQGFERMTTEDAEFMIDLMETLLD